MIDKNFTEFIDNESFPLSWKTCWRARTGHMKLVSRKKRRTGCPVEIRKPVHHYKGKDIGLPLSRALTEQKQLTHAWRDLLHAPNRYVRSIERPDSSWSINSSVRITGYSNKNYCPWCLQVYTGDLALLRKYNNTDAKGQRTELMNSALFDRHGESIRCWQSVAPSDFLNRGLI